MTTRKVNYEKINSSGNLAVGMANYYGLRFYVGEKLIQPTGEVGIATGAVSIPVKYLTDEYFQALIDGINTARKDYQGMREELIKKALEEKKKLLAPLDIKIKAAQDILKIYQQNPADCSKEIEATQKSIEKLQAQRENLLKI